ncbi:hypothetical protein SUNI508_10511 [Seiridium unicorne]|uniref:Uncharacterized protein n=1 Tax=Seiridium unicorne TaxID=138068 RepID=A0ABR2ULH8_9PEZI
MSLSPTATNQSIGTQERSQPDRAPQDTATSSRKKHTSHKKHHMKHDTKTSHASSASTMVFPDQSHSPGHTLEDAFASFNINEDYVYLTTPYHCRLSLCVFEQINYPNFDSPPISDLDNIGAQFDIGQGGSVIGLSAATGSRFDTAWNEEITDPSIIL